MAAAPAVQQRHSLDNPIFLPFTPSGPTSHDSSDIFNVHKIRLAPIARLPHSGQLPASQAGVGPSGKAAPVGQQWTDPGPVAEGLEVETSAPSDAGMSDAGSSRAGDDPQERHWGVLQAAKNAFWRRCDYTFQLLILLLLLLMLLLLLVTCLRLDAENLMILSIKADAALVSEAYLH